MAVRVVGEETGSIRLDFETMTARERRLILVGGSAGSGKTSVTRTLAGDLGAGWLQLNRVWIAMKAAAGQGSSAYSLLDVVDRMGRGGDCDDELLAAHVAASEAVCEVLPLGGKTVRIKHDRMFIGRTAAF